MRLKWWASKKPNEPPSAPAPTPPSIDTLTGLITSLADASAKRFQAQLEHDTRTEEINLKRRDLELQHAEQIAQANVIEREGKEKLRQAKREWAEKNGGPSYAKSAKARQQNLTDCKVCVDKSDPYLNANDISWHYAGHPARNGS
jgi:hypothetical protein